MNAFRGLALAYTLAALLIAPAWLVADDAPLPAPDPAGQPAPEAAPAPQPEAAPVAEPPVAAAAPARGEILVEDEQEAADAAGEATDAAGEAKQEPVASVAASASVTIKDFEYAPASVTVNVGDTVTWTNDGPTAHSATAGDGSFDTGIMEKGKSGSATFSTAGTIAYVCTPHPFMMGTVVVKGESAGSDDDSGSDDGSESGAADGDDGGSAGTATDSSGSGSGLPATGGETALIALLGLLTLGAGLLLRRRAEG